MSKDGLLYKIKEGLSDMLYIWANELRNVFRDQGVLIFFILVPLGYPLVYSWIYTAEVVRENPVAVVDMDHTALSREFIRKLDASPDVKVAYYCMNLEEAKDLVGRQKVKGVIYLPSDFEKNIARKEQSVVSVFCDMGLMLSYKGIYQASSAVALDMGAEIQAERSSGFTNRDDELTTEPLRSESVNIFNASAGYGNFLLPAVLVLIIHQTLLFGIGLSAGTARENNRFRELVPISKHYNGIFRIVFGKAMCYFMIYCVMCTYAVVCVPQFFQYTAIMHAHDLFLFMAPFLLATIFFAMTFSCLVRYRENVILLVVFTSVPLLFLSGISWPESAMPRFWRIVACIFPSTFGMRGYVRMASMGGLLSDVAVEYHALWIQSFIYLLTTCAVYRFQILRARALNVKTFEHIRNMAHQARLRSKSTTTSAEEAE